MFLLLLCCPILVLAEYYSQQKYRQEEEQYSVTDIHCSRAGGGYSLSALLARPLGYRGHPQFADRPEGDSHHVVKKITQYNNHSQIIPIH